MTPSSDAEPGPSARADLNARIEAIEAGYEFLLAFAAQGVRDDRESPSGGQLRILLGGMADALDGLPDTVRATGEALGVEPADVFARYADVLARDAEASHAAVRLVQAREAISSQLVDNLNASIHVRALLTDLFLVDDLLR